MFPHERSLVKKMEGKPFVLIGVNGDDNDPELKAKNEKEQITWRSFKNARPGGAPIADEWGLQGWPTLYLIDHKGVIRHKWLGSPGDQVIDQAVEELVKEAEGAAKG
jgi:hypothetical protein